MSKKNYRLLLQCLLITTLTSALYSITNPVHVTQAAETPVAKEVNYDIESDQIGTRDNAVFSGNYVLKSTTIHEDMGPGKKISKIVFYTNDRAVHSINVNAQTFNEQVRFLGDPIKVTSTGNTANGSWFAWERISSSPAWRAGEGENWKEIGSVMPEQEEIEGRKYDKYPGKKVEISVDYARTKEFRAEGYTMHFPTNLIDKRVSTLNELNPSTPSTGAKVSVEMDQVVTNEGASVSGRAHASTQIISMKFINLDKAVIKYTQMHDDPGVIVNLNTSGSKAMMYYFAAYSYDLSSYTYRYPNKYKVFLDDVPPPLEPDAACTDPEPGQQLTTEYMDPDVSAVIKADSRGNEQFNVLDGIPTSEYLYGNILAKEYLAKSTFTQMSGVCTYEVPVKKTYNLVWSEESEDEEGNTVKTPQSDTEEFSEVYTVERPYSYWIISNLEVYSIEEGILQNYALPDEEIIITPSGYSPPDYIFELTGDYYPPEATEVDLGSETIGSESETSRPSVPPEDFQSEAEEAVDPVEVENDFFEFTGELIMDDTRTEEEGPTPGEIPEPQFIDENVLYSPGNLISSSKQNKQDTESTGTITYSAMESVEGSNEDQEFSIEGINTVTVHTPVVNYSSVTDDWPHNQKTNPNYDRAAFILERPFTVRIPTEGQHTDYLGYGDRDYAKYYRTKQVLFPFDVYNESRTQFIPRHTWIDIPVNQLDTTFYLPVWVDEGDYQVYFRNVAENAPSDFTNQAEQDANLDLIHHLASDEVSVEVIGRLYDYRITDIADYNWENVFRQKIGSSASTGISYWVGTQGIDGDPRGNKEQYTTAIRPGSNPIQGYKNVAIKTGYHFKFDFKTKGNMFGPDDGIRITPSFYFVTKDGRIRTPVDLYYKTNSQNFIKVGSEDDKVQRYVILNERLRNVPTEQLNDTAGYKYHNYTSIHNGLITEKEYSKYYRTVLTKMKTPVGGYSLLMLPEQLRTFIGPKTNIPANASADIRRANASIQQWYSEYSLPAEPYVVASGTNIAEYGRTHGGLDEKSPIFLKDGYIIVNFNLESIKEGNVSNPHLQYINAPLMNQWDMEGFNRTAFDSYGNLFSLFDGDIVFYHADRSSRDDFSSQVPH